MNELIAEFKLESQEIISELLNELNELEEDLSRVAELEKFGQKVDRIMGGATSLAMSFDQNAFLVQIGSCAGLCKTLGYRGSQIRDNEALSGAVVAVLLEMTEILKVMVDLCGTPQENKFDLKSKSLQILMDRLKWLSNQFSADIRSSLSMDSRPVSSPVPSSSDESIIQSHQATDLTSQLNDFLKKFGMK